MLENLQLNDIKFRRKMREWNGQLCVRQSLMTNGQLMVNREDNEKCSEETQTLRAGCSKVEPKNFALPQTPFPGAQDWLKFNHLEMVTTFTYKPSLVRISTRNFELSW